MSSLPPLPLYTLVTQCDLGLCQFYFIVKCVTKVHSSLYLSYKMQTYIKIICPSLDVGLGLPVGMPAVVGLAYQFMYLSILRKAQVTLSIIGV